jgi:uncharacterized OsmC-like protein
MDAEQLRSLQVPLKEKYRQRPAAALVTLSANGELGEDVTCNVETWAGIARAGLHPATGGDGTDACSGDMLLQALVACAGVTLKAVATAISVNIRRGEIKAEGDIDFRGTLGVEKSAPVGFKNIRLTFALDADADEEKLASLIKLTERYCVIYQTLKNSPDVKVSSNRGEGA